MEDKDVKIKMSICPECGNALVYKTLQKMKSYNVDLSEFIRQAIKEKIKREYSNLLPKFKKEYCPF